MAKLKIRVEFNMNLSQHKIASHRFPTMKNTDNIFIWLILKLDIDFLKKTKKNKTNEMKIVTFDLPIYFSKTGSYAAILRIEMFER